MAYSSWIDQIHSWGWQLGEKLPQGGDCSLALPYFQGRLLDESDFRSYLRQLLDTNGRTEIPDSIQRVLASIACRSAVMFGDRLDPQQGQAVVENLKATRLSFQCAHGRPTVAPLIDMGNFRTAALEQKRCTAEQSAVALEALRAKLLRIRCKSL